MLIENFCFSGTAILIRLHFWRFMLGPRLAFISELELCQLELCFRSFLISWSHYCVLFPFYRLSKGQRTERKKQGSNYANAWILVNSLVLSYRRFWLHLNNVNKIAVVIMKKGSIFISFFEINLWRYFCRHHSRFHSRICSHQLKR